MGEHADPSFSLAGKRVWVAGHRGMVGAALLRGLAGVDCEVVTVGREALDLRRQADVEAWMAAERPQAVFVAAATVGGIEANDSRPAEFIADNLAIAANVIHSAHLVGVDKLMMLGSACIYPKLAPQPVAEEALLSGPPEPTNAWYSVAKIAAVKMCQAYRRQHRRDFIAVAPTNLYGPGDNFDAAASHVVPALIRKVHEAKAGGRDEVEVWGSGKPRRELMLVDDAAAALLFLMERYSEEALINVAGAEEVSIAELATLIAGVVGFAGGFRFDAGRPDGAPRKALDAGRIRALGWRPAVGLGEGLGRTYAWYLAALADRGTRLRAG